MGSDARLDHEVEQRALALRRSPATAGNVKNLEGTFNEISQVRTSGGRSHEWSRGCHLRVGLFNDRHQDHVRGERQWPQCRGHEGHDHDGPVGQGHVYDLVDDQ